MAKLYSRGVSGKLLSWLQSYLSNRSIRVVLSGQAQQISIWGDRWKTTFEPSKCKLITLSRKKIPSHEDLHFNGYRLTTTNKLDILDINVDNKLSWSEHLSKISIRAGQKLAAIRKVASKLTTESQAIVYKLQVQGVMGYASLSWMSAPPTYLGLLDNTQKKALKIIGVDQDSASTKLSIPSLTHKRQVAAATVLYKMHTHHCPTDLQVMLPPSYTR